MTMLRSNAVTCANSQSKVTTIGRSTRLSPVLATIGVLSVLAAACGSATAASHRTSADLPTTRAGVASSLVSAAVEAEKYKRYAQARSDLVEVLEINPHNAYAYYDLGTVDQGLGRASAASDYRHALALDPDFRPAMFNLASSLTGSSPRAAAAEYRRLERVDPNDPDVEFNLGLVLESIGEKAAGRAQLLAAIKKDPSLLGRLPRYSAARAAK
jgi:Flp pilus assembly protein TadD